MIEQNDIFRQTLEIELKRFGRESRVNMLNERPWFIIAGQSPHSPNLVQLSLKNKGIEATYITIVGGAQIGANWTATLQSATTAATEEKIVVAITSTVEIENIHFSIEYQGHDGRRLSQRINKVPGSNFKMESP